MHTGNIHRVCAALVLSVVLTNGSGTAYMSSIAESAHRRQAACRRRRAEYGEALASLIREQYALDAGFRVRNPPSFNQYVRPR
jgi:hypothetical protein